MKTTRIGVTQVIGAGVSITAILRAPTHTRSPGANICNGAFISIIAACTVGRVHASDCRVARVVGTEVSIIAIGCSGAHATSTDTRINQSTCISVIAHSNIGSVGTPRIRRASIICAGIPIIAVWGSVTHTYTGLAGIGSRTGIAIITSNRVVDKYAEYLLITGICLLYTSPSPRD